MPYTKNELRDIGFYNQYIDKLRGGYISRLITSALKKFRTDENVLQSFEDIDGGLGIEDASILNNPTYSTLETELHRRNLDIFDFKTLGNIQVDVKQGVQYVIENTSCSIQTETQKQTRKDQNSDALVDRLINELMITEIANPLPDDLKNGDTITSDNVDDVRKWLIDGNQKRPFPDLQSFYAIGSEWRNVKTKSQEVIDSIPEGEPVD
jgi:hypothetical protein